VSEERSLEELQRGWPQTLKLYVIGFLGSLFLTLISFSLAVVKLFSPKILIVILVFLGLMQAFVQLVFFMHMGKEEKPRWMSFVFGYMVLVLLIVILGSLWIIMDLDNRVMPAMHS
jgi:cytochrome o ubiquinol oxidase operon protein cyoD